MDNKIKKEFLSIAYNRYENDLNNNTKIHLCKFKKSYIILLTNSWNDHKTAQMIYHYHNGTMNSVVGDDIDAHTSNYMDDDVILNKLIMIDMLLTIKLNRWNTTSNERYSQHDQVQNYKEQRWNTTSNERYSQQTSLLSKMEH